MNKQKIIKAGIVGCGLIASHKYIPSFKKAGIEILALCDLNENLAKEVAGKNAIPKAYSDLDNMMSQNELDLVSICTPPATHAKLGLAALRYNVHLLIEKPMALSTADCDELTAEANKRNKKICVGHSDLFYPPVMEAQRLVSEGYIGKFMGMRILLSTPTDYALSKKDHWIHKLPGGILGETGPHAVYLTTAFIKNIDEIKVMTKKNHPYEWILYDDIRIELKGSNGISSIVITHSTDLWDAKIDIFGSNKNLYIDMHEFFIQAHNRKDLKLASIAAATLKKDIHSLFNIGKNALLTIFGRISYGHELLVRKFADSILNDKPSPVPPEAGRDVVRLMEEVLNKV